MITPSTNSSASILNDDSKIKPGIYKIQNVFGQTYLEIRDHSKELCCRPVAALEDGKGLWEILPCGIGYTIRRLDPGDPVQFCTMLGGLGNDSVVSVSPFLATWRIEIVNEELYRGCNHVRIFWATTKMHWDLKNHGSAEDRTPVQLRSETSGFELSIRMWKLIPMQLDDRFQPAPAIVTARSNPPNTTGTRQTDTSAEINDDGFGITVVEVSTTTTTTTDTVTKRKKYRVEGNQELVMPHT